MNLDSGGQLRGSGGDAAATESQRNSIRDLVTQARERLGHELQGHAEEFQKLEQSLKELRERHQRLEQAVQDQLEELAKYEPPAPPPPSEPPMEHVLAAVRNLITATLPEQVLAVLTEEAEQLGVRAAVFDVRGKAAWGAAARGFGSEFSSKAFRTLAVPLNQDTPFRQVYETCAHADVTTENLKKNKNVLDRLKPIAGDPILLLPIRSTGSVSSIFYADAGGKKKKELPVNALKILAEFAGAQLDRLVALGGGLPPALVEKRDEDARPAAVVEHEEVHHEAEEPERVEEPVGIATGASAGAQASASVAEISPQIEMPPPPPPDARSMEQLTADPAPQAVGIDISQISEEDQRVHKDAKRFAKLLISEIELYNKAKVADGRKNKDLYKRLKSDIDRSRQTYEKRFSKTVAKQSNYLHEELVKTLASNDPSLLGPEYPGPSA